MFKGFSNSRRNNAFNGFPALNFQMNNEAYGFSGCTFWLDAAYGTNTQTDLAAVSSWQSRIGGITFTQATAGNQPRYIISNSLYNNYSTVEFFDNARFMSTIFPIPNGKGMTIIMVANYNTINATNPVIASDIVAEVGQYIMGGTAAGSLTGCALINSAGTTLGSGTTESTSSKIVCFNETEIVVNGTQEYTGSGLIVDWKMSQIGRSRTQTTQALLGNIAEILVFNNKISGSNLSRLSANINSKYAFY